MIIISTKSSSTMPNIGRILASAHGWFDIVEQNLLLCRLFTLRYKLYGKIELPVIYVPVNDVKKLLTRWKRIVAMDAFHRYPFSSPYSDWTTYHWIYSWDWLTGNVVAKICEQIVSVDIVAAHNSDFYWNHKWWIECGWYYNPNSCVHNAILIALMIRVRRSHRKARYLRF